MYVSRDIARQTRTGNPQRPEQPSLILMFTKLLQQSDERIVTEESEATWPGSTTGSADACDLRGQKDLLLRAIRIFLCRFPKCRC